MWINVGSWTFTQDPRLRFCGFWPWKPVCADVASTLRYQYLFVVSRNLPWQTSCRHLIHSKIYHYRQNNSQVFPLKDRNIIVVLSPKAYSCLVKAIIRKAYESREKTILIREIIYPRRSLQRHRPHRSKECSDAVKKYESSSSITKTGITRTTAELNKKRRCRQKTAIYDKPNNKNAPIDSFTD